MDDAERSKYFEENTTLLAFTRSVTAYASSAGLLTDIYDTGTSVLSHLPWGFGETLKTDYGIRGRRNDRFLGGVIAPSAGWVNDVYGALTGFDPHKLARSAPGSNIPYIRPWIDPLLADDGDTPEP